MIDVSITQIINKNRAIDKSRVISVSNEKKPSFFREEKREINSPVGKFFLLRGPAPENCGPGRFFAG
jgi:hypothetical protein